MRKCLLIAAFAAFQLAGNAQAVYEDDRYVPEKDPAAAAKIAEWQGLKFGLLMHWGTYSQWGIVESWQLCPEDEGWCERTGGTKFKNYFEYKKEYEALQHTFNPTKFDPTLWAKAAKDAGMRYVVFTTKHHDGFCMFDSKYTSYKVTDPSCPFSTNPKANIAKEVFSAFRSQGLWAGAYFSKPDWHCEWYWDPYYPPFDRNVNYDPNLHPDKWKKYVEYTQNQINELLTDYGKIDILWFDGGWVAKKKQEDLTEYYKRVADTKGGFLKHRVVDQDIDMDKIKADARKKQPGIIVVDRAVTGPNQNYLTPENRVPEKALPYPWESCMIAGGGWSYVPDAKFISGKEGVHLLVDIVAKGGNLLLNIAPAPDGTWPEGAYKLLKEYASWMKVNSEAIYGTSAIAPFKEENICMTQKGNNLYFLYLSDDDKMPSQITVKSHQPAKGSKVTMLGYKGNLSWKKNGDGFTVAIPESLRKSIPCSYAWTLKITK